VNPQQPYGNQQPYQQNPQSNPYGQPAYGQSNPYGQSAYGQANPYGQPNPYGPQSGGGSRGLAITSGVVSIVVGLIGLLFMAIGLIAVIALYSRMSKYTSSGQMIFGLVTLSLAVLSCLSMFIGGILVLARKKAGPLMSGISGAVVLATGLASTVNGGAAVGVIIAVLGAVVAVLAFLPGTRHAMGRAAGAYGQPAQYGQAGGYPPQQPGQWY
jgi:hypothetical protein